MKEKINISIDKDLLVKLDRYAKDEGRTRSNMIERILYKELFTIGNTSLTTDKTEG